MKVLFCDNTLWGLLNFRGKVLEHFLNKGYEVVCVAPKEENAQMSAVDVEVLKRVRYIDIKMERTSRGIRSNLSYIKQLWHIFKKEKPNLIFTYTIKPNALGGMIAWLQRLPFIAIVAGLGTVFETNHLKDRLTRLIYRMGLRKAKHVFVLNQGNLDVLVKGGFCKPDRITRLTAGEGVDLSLFPQTANFEQPADTHFLMIARVLKDKGYCEYIEAAKKVHETYPDTHFELLGFIDEDAPCGISVAQVMEDMKHYPFRYIGYTHDMYQVYNRKDLVIVLPSYHEGLNRTLMESAASGKPIITTNISGCKECVEDGVNGFLCEPKSAESLAEALMKYMALSFEQRKAMAEASRHLAEERFSIQKVIEVYDQFI